MVIDGKQIAGRIFAKLKPEIAEMVESLGRPPRLDIIYIGSDKVIDAFVRIKTRKAEAIGIITKVHRLPADTSQDEAEKIIKQVSADEQVDGVVVQLPLPSHLDRERLLSLVPVAKDVDVLSEEGSRLFRFHLNKFMPPVAGAVEEILREGGIEVHNKKVAVLGTGRLVGEPVIDWLRLERAKITVLRKGDSLDELQMADIIISGTGVPNLVQPDMIKDGVALVDAGTSESGGVISGDIDASCADKASLYTPVPGGVGPVTVAVLCRNVVLSASSRQALAQ